MRNLLLTLSLFSWLAASAVAAEPAFHAVGDDLSEITLEDQFGQPAVIDAATQILLFSRDMNGGKVLQAALADTDEGTLPAMGAVYVSDISGMPSLIAKMFALPRMRKRPYPMMLDRSGEVTIRIPDYKDQATVIFLEKLRIVRVEHVDSPNEVRALLGLAPIPSSDE